MPRPKKCRRVCDIPRTLSFFPEDRESEEAVILTVDEYETIRLIDKEGLSQEQCGDFMQVARTTDSAVSRAVKKGAVLHSGSMDCTGLLLVRQGQLRAYILSDEGREITLYRLFDRDICLFSASSFYRNFQ